MCPAMVTLCVRSGSVTSLYYKVLLQYYSVLQSTTNSSTTLYYTVLQRTAPVLLCTAKYYSSTTLYYKVLLQYYSVLQSATPVLLCTTKYYSSTTLYCKVLLQYYSVLQSATPVLLCTTQYYNVLLQYYPVLQSTTPVLLCTAKYYSSTTLYYKVLLQYYSVLHSTTTYYSSTTLYYKAAFMIDPWHIWTVIYMIDVRRIWNVIYNARSNRSHPPTSPNTAPATQNDCDDWSASHMKRHLQCAEQQASPSNLTKYCACRVKRISSLIRVTYETSFTMRGATSIALQRHQILRLPHKKSLVFDPRHIWNVIYNARSNRHRPPTSPNTAPATQNDSHDWSSSHMERHLQCAEQQASPCNLTKYCACHAKWLSWLIFVTYGTSFTMRGATGITLQPHQILRLPRKSALQNLSEILRERLKRQFQCAADSTMIRTWSDHELVISHPPVRRGYFSRFGDAFCIENYNISRSGYLLKFHRILRLPQKVTLQDHQMLRLPRKMMRIIDCRRICNVIYNARSNRHRPPTSPNTAPATQNDSHDWSSSHMERHLQCAEQQASPSNLTKCCACHAKWLSWLIFVTYETSFTMRGATGITSNLTKYCACHAKLHSKI